jgi:hypothetical protein
MIGSKNHFSIKGKSSTMITRDTLEQSLVNAFHPSLYEFFGPIMANMSRA